MFRPTILRRPLSLVPLALIAGLCAPASASPKAVEKLPPPMIFFVAKGGADACGPGCDTWIAAEGTIDQAAGARLERFLARHGRRDLPIFLNSPGGVLEQSIVMGRTLRARKPRVGVGRTFVADCKAGEADELCDRLRKSGRELKAELKTDKAICASACIYLLLGGASREVAWNAMLGVHSPKVFRIRNGRRMAPSGPAEIRAATMTSAILAAKVDRYVRDMGIDAELMQVTRSVAFENVRVLTRDEIFRFGIDKREFADSGWAYETTGSGSVVSNTLFRKEWGGQGKFATMSIAVSCLSRGRLGLSYRAIGAADSILPANDIVLTFGADAVRLKAASEIAGPRDRRSAALPEVIAERFWLADAISIAQLNTEEAALLPTALKSTGFAKLISHLIASCPRPEDDKTAHPVT